MIEELDADRFWFVDNDGIYRVRGDEVAKLTESGFEPLTEEQKADLAKRCSWADGIENMSEEYTHVGSMSDLAQSLRTEKKVIPELKKELLGDFYLYECNHLTSGEYGTQGVLPVGRYANILVCKHCWQNLQAMFLADLFRDLLQTRASVELTTMMCELLNEMGNPSRLEYGDPRLGKAEDDE